MHIKHSSNSAHNSRNTTTEQGGLYISYNKNDAKLAKVPVPRIQYRVNASNDDIPKKASYTH